MKYILDNVLLIHFTTELLYSCTHRQLTPNKMAMKAQKRLYFALLPIQKNHCCLTIVFYAIEYIVWQVYGKMLHASEIHLLQQPIGNHQLQHACISFILTRTPSEAHAEHFNPTSMEIKSQIWSCCKQTKYKMFTFYLIYGIPCEV